MSFNLVNNLNRLSTQDKDNCWYIVRQRWAFWEICYAVSILREYKMTSPGVPLKDFFESRAQSIASSKGFSTFIEQYRVLRGAYYLGLLKKNGTRYEDSEITEVFDEVESRCAGNFEDVTLYYDIIERQIEKIFISSSIDENYSTLRSDYRLYPLFLLYKVLLEVGRVTGEYKITIEEFNTFVGTTTTYDEAIYTIYNILECRNRIASGDIRIIRLFDSVKDKFDGNRFNLVLKNLPYIYVDTDTIEIRNGSVNNIRTKVYHFEHTTRIFNDSDYLEFLTSTDFLI